MHISTLRNTLLFLSALLPTTTTALGINCRGSGVCHLASFQNRSRLRITQGLRDAVWDSARSNSTTYGNGDHIICVSQFQQITFTGEDENGGGAEGVTQSMTSQLSLSGALGSGGICLFAQYMGNGQTLSLGDIRALTDAVIEHGCKTCGSVPIHYEDQGSNDPRWGILTFNYVDNPYCDGNCLSANGQPWTNGTVTSSSTQFSRLKRSARIGERVEDVGE